VIRRCHLGDPAAASGRGGDSTPAAARSWRRRGDTTNVKCPRGPAGYTEPRQNIVARRCVTKFDASEAR
jgi:hypothetical protein